VWEEKDSRGKGQAEGGGHAGCPPKHEKKESCVVNFQRYSEREKAEEPLKDQKKKKMGIGL